VVHLRSLTQYTHTHTHTHTSVARDSGFTPEKPLDLEDALTMWLTSVVLHSQAAAPPSPTASAHPPSPSAAARSNVAAAMRARGLGEGSARLLRVEELQMDLRCVWGGGGMGVYVGGLEGVCGGRGGAEVGGGKVMCVCVCPCARVPGCVWVHA